MSKSVALAEVWRGPFMESVHRGHAVVCDDSGQIVHAWGDPQTVILPRSSAKMIQALPLIESGAADAHGLGTEHLALACASHNGAAIHTDRVTKWLDHLGLDDGDFRCGPQEPDDREARNALIRADARPCQMHNNCSGKHSGFLTLNKHLGAGPDYVDPDHAVQRACLEAFERVTGESSPGFGIDGCSAPNFATSLHGMARAMSHFAAAPTGSAEERLRTAMTLHPDLVAGEGRACTNLMRAMGGKVAIKTGAEAFFIAIIPELKMGVALKIEDGGTRAAECAIAAILVKLGVLAADHPETLKYLNAPIRNRRDLVTGAVRAAPALI
ncbi:asparaginase [Sulfitobacter pseudonitzschiae]|uniref:Asparaginase n=1 Tax=Pseudosulfitobacter pseudonitzschiae TaxID=1402135 RepID=A0A9Q2RQP9_9RHOB|nr:asparaginase [Pseudosulfitobacter pseudonitzschiae]MBM2290553.1 asparaginase [Pseudosulfitobacter pseudonitzschiae]MBM2295471.1 asparaginase [Pseudosulfitobacter pseudonitzschiae]MBM2300383.1 asparaginase [Pseudosulfitobacter pseudonitzschiae]MBM2310168.1 asparaginase [Pseudosulfitobacter pseudonitzschiae]MBM2315080.1 asparaginase [Pseudosulfitobacter pseudonitzschiae]|tara:strand:+ start:249 stop:1229 length:981 start_codon:yes stop_codon:yes gene_type:complete